VSAAAQPPPGLARAVGRIESAAPAGPATALTRREATLRSAATACLTGIALVHAIELPSVLARSAVLGALVLGGTALCIAGGLALATTPASAAPNAWRAVAATATLVLAGWGLPHAVALPAPAGARGDWTATPGVACAGLAVACLALAAAAARPARATARRVATALVVLVAWGPGGVAFLVATGPGPRGGEAAIDPGGHVHAQGVVGDRDIVLRRGPTGDHYVTRVTTPPRPPAAGVALLAAAASVFVAGAVMSLRRRSAAPG
jgi:hypothetical protein